MKKIEKCELTFGAANIGCADLLGKDILIIGYAGAAGARKLAAARKDLILARFAPIIYNKAVEAYDMMDEESIMDFLEERHAICKIACGIGGIEGALFDLANAFSIGMEVYTKDIPIRQDTIEISNLLDVNPYKLYSADCYVVITADGKRTAKELVDKGIYASVVGHITKGLDKVFINNDERSYIVPSRGKDEIYKYIPKGEIL